MLFETDPDVMSYVLLITDRPEKVFAANTFTLEVTPP